VSDFAVVIPVRGLFHGKSRLAPVLDPDERARIVAATANHVLRVVLGFAPGARVIVVTRDRETGWLLTDQRVEIVTQPDTSWGLNAALDVGRSVAITGDPERVLMLPADLPLLTVDDLAALMTSPSEVTLATDKAGTGTNALLLTGQTAIETLPFHFGEGSRRLHEEGALALGLDSTTVSVPGLQDDLDTPDDWSTLPDRVRDQLLADDRQPAMMLETA
jgi:2-phospho-L-lactate guanylyltransferase